MQVGREHEASNLGPEDTDRESGTDAKVLKLIIESINVSSANTNRNTILARKAHVQMIQETCLTKAQNGDMQREAKKVKKQFQGGPADPEQAKAAAGVGIVK